jgi:hypothetical protein
MQTLVSWPRSAVLFGRSLSPQCKFLAKRRLGRLRRVRSYRGAPHKAAGKLMALRNMPDPIESAA